MRRISLLILLAFSLSSAFAQKANLSAAEDNKSNLLKLDKAKESIELALKNDETKELNKTWYIAGEIYKNIGTITDADVKSLKISFDPKKLEPNALTLALSSYLKAIELGKLQKKDKFKKDILTESFPQLRTGFYYSAVEGYNANDFAKSFDGFRNALKVDSLMFELKDKKASEKFAVDTSTYFNAGMTANKVGQYKLSNKYFEVAIANKYNVPNCYIFMSSNLKASKDTAGAIEVLKKGIAQEPNNSVNMLNELINIYLVAGNSAEAIKLLDLAISKDPKNESYYFAKGQMYEKIKDEAKAIESYNKAIEVKPAFFDAYYNIGVVYYNRAVKVREDADKIPLNEKDKFQEKLELYKVKLKDALPFMEKAHELDPKEKTTISALKVIYSKTGDKAKADAMQAKLDALK